MDTPPRTLEVQRELLRRREEGWRKANEIQAEEARNRTEAEKWAVADELQQAADSLTDRHEIPKGNPDEHGLVVQQRIFARKLNLR